GDEGGGSGGERGVRGALRGSDPVVDGLGTGDGAVKVEEVAPIIETGAQGPVLRPSIRIERPHGPESQEASDVGARGGHHRAVLGERAVDVTPGCIPGRGRLRQVEVAPPHEKVRPAEVPGDVHAQAGPDRLEHADGAEERPGRPRVGAEQAQRQELRRAGGYGALDRKSTRLNSSHVKISYAVF